MAKCADHSNDRSAFVPGVDTSARSSCRKNRANREHKAYSNTWVPVFDNSVDAYIPELWAQESLMILEANMVMAGLVHRDFENEIAEFGDIVNTRRPQKFEAKRKTDNSNGSSGLFQSINFA